MKRALTVAILLICLALCCVLSACDTITYSVQIATGGQRTMSLYVYYDAADTAQQKENVKRFLGEVRDVRNANGRQCELVEEAAYIVLREQFESATDYYIAMGYTGDEVDEEVPYVDLNAYFVEYRSPMRLADAATVLGYTLQYAVSTQPTLALLWRAYCGGKSAVYIDNLAPVYQRLAASDDVVAATIDALSGEYGVRLGEELCAWLADKGYDVAEVDFRYTYEHLYKSVYPTAYDRSYTNGATGATVYEWDMKVADIADATIEICQKAPRVWAWELTAIAAGIAVIGVILLIILAKRRKINASGEAREE